MYNSNQYKSYLHHNIQQSQACHVFFLAALSLTLLQSWTWPLSLDFLVLNVKSQSTQTCTRVFTKGLRTRFGLLDEWLGRALQLKMTRTRLIFWMTWLGLGLVFRHSDSDSETGASALTWALSKDGSSPFWRRPWVKCRTAERAPPRGRCGCLYPMALTPPSASVALKQDSSISLCAPRTVYYCINWVHNVQLRLMLRSCAVAWKQMHSQALGSQWRCQLFLNLIKSTFRKCT